MNDFTMLYILSRVDNLFRDKLRTEDYYHLIESLRSNNKDKQVLAFITIILRENEFKLN